LPEVLDRQGDEWEDEQEGRQICRPGGRNGRPNQGKWGVVQRERAGKNGVYAREFETIAQVVWPLEPVEGDTGSCKAAETEVWKTRS
jgi:hypothetical protein